MSETTEQTLELVLQQEMQCTEQLLQVLAAERAALAERDMATLEQTTRKKLEHSQSLEKLDAQREEIISMLGFDTGRSGVTQCFSSLPKANKLANLWQQILKNVEACKTGNLINGGILESGRQQVEQALSILRGQGAANTLYTPGGTSSTNLGNRKLGKV